MMVKSIDTNGGVERILPLLVRELSLYHKCIILSLFGLKKNLYSMDNLKIIRLNQGMQRIRYIFFYTIYRLIKIIRSYDIDILVIHARGSHIMPLLIKPFTNTKIIFCEHSSILQKNFFEKNLKEKMYDTIFQFCINNFSDQIILLTEKERKNYLKNNKKLTNKKIKVIPNFIDDRLLHNLKKYNKYSKKIITVGRIDFSKGYEYLVNVVKFVFTKHPDWQWHIYGDGEQNYKNQITDLIKQNDLEKYVILQGNHSDIYDLYQDYSFYVMTSRYEGLPMVLLEAKAKKLPIISFDINSGPSDIVRNGVDGFLVEPFDCEAMADKICELIENPELRQKFSDNSHGNLDKFSKEKIIKQWCDLIEEVSK